MGAPMSLPRIDILMAGSALQPIREKYGDFDRWFQDRTPAPVRYRVRALFDGAPLPDVSESDGWIITGSPGSVNDRVPGMGTVQAGIAQAVGGGHPVLGVCFGHQLLAVSLGGAVGENPNGWELGLAIIALTDAGDRPPLFRGLGPRFPVYESHREVVTSLPADGQILAQNEMGLQAFQLGDRAFGVQFHPEFTLDIVRMYVQLRSGEPMPPLQGRRGHPDDSRQVLTNFIQSITL